MNFLHVSDLHIGRKLGGKLLLEDQRHILAEILQMAAQEDIHAVLVAGDIYDKSQPSSEAVEMADWFMTSLAGVGKPCFIVSGNHDSAEQVAYCRSLLEGAGLHISPAYHGAVEPQVLRDEWGEIHIYMLPFLRPMAVRRAYPERAGEIAGYADALRVAVEEMHVDPSVRNVLLAHQLVLGGMEPELTDSEERMVGGVDAVPAEIFDCFDYVALGHLHSPQRVKGDRIRYAGSPLKYSLSEEKQRKAALKVCLGDGLLVEELPYHPLREVKSVTGRLADITSGIYDSDYVFVTLTDELPPLDIVGSLQLSYPNLVQHRICNSRSGDKSDFVTADRVEELNPLEHFINFFSSQNNGQAPSEVQLALMKKIVEEAEESLYASH